MNETDFQELYIKFSNSEDPKIHKQCCDKLHQVVYMYPIRRHQSDADVAADFYSYFFPKIEKIFSEFDPTLGVSFAAFVSVKLKFGFINFIRSSKHTIAEDEYEIGGQQELKLAKRQLASEEESSQWSSLREKIHQAICELIEDEQLSLLLLYCFPLQLNHFRILFKRHQSFDFFAQYRQYLVKIVDWQIKDKQEKEIVFAQLRRIQLKISQNHSSPDRQKMEKRRDFLIQKAYSNNGPIKLKHVADLMRQAVHYVFRKVKSAKEKLKEILSHDLAALRSKTA